MKRWFILFIVSVLAVIACTTKRRLQTDTSQQQESHSHTLQQVNVRQADSVQEIRLQRNFDQQEAIVLSPVGAFRYHPDSGFIGEASKLVLYRQKSVQEDSSLRSGGRQVSRSVIAISDSSHVGTQHEVIEKSVHRSAAGWSWWMAGLLAVVLGGSVWLLWRRIRR